MSEKIGGLIEHAKGRSKKVSERLLTAQRAIELEIEQNNGVYPLNGGRLTQAELCRRAGIKQVTLQGIAHKTTTKLQVDQWLQRTRECIAQGKKAVRRAVTERVTDMKTELERIASSYCVAELEMNHLRRRVGQLEEEVKVLAEENRSLLVKLSEGKVVRLGKH